MEGSSGEVDGSGDRVKGSGGGVGVLCHWYAGGGEEWTMVLLAGCWSVGPWLGGMAGGDGGETGGKKLTL